MARNYKNAFEVKFVDDTGFEKTLDIEAETCAEVRQLAESGRQGYEDLDDGVSTREVQIVSIKRIVKLADELDEDEDAE